MNQAEADRDNLARTIWGEARGELYGGQVAIANVVMNRFKRPGWWSRERGDGIPDDTIQAVCRDPWQFSCWNKGDPNLPHMLALTDEELKPYLFIADAYVNKGAALDLTFGSTHYHNSTVSPDWAEGKTPVVQIGRHFFYNQIS